MKILRLLVVLLLWPILGWAQTFTHPNLATIDLQIASVFAKIKTAQTEIVKGQAEVKDP